MYHTNRCVVCQANPGASKANFLENGGREGDGPRRRGARRSVRLRRAPNNRKLHVVAFLWGVATGAAAAIYTDPLGSYDKIGDENTLHAFNHVALEWVQGDVHIKLRGERVVAAGSPDHRLLPHLSTKHLLVCLHECEWRFNNCEDRTCYRTNLCGCSAPRRLGPAVKQR